MPTFEESGLAGIDFSLWFMLVAPAVRVFEFIEADGLAFQGRLAVFVGDDDEFCDVEEAQDLGRRLGATVTVVPGDHYFMKSRRKVAEQIVPWIAPGVAGATA